MDFPAYVPAAVRMYIATLIEGDSLGPMGWAQVLARVESQLVEIEGAIANQIRHGTSPCLDGLRKQRAETAGRRDRLAGDVDCLGRLAQDARMADAFARLTLEFTDDQQWQGFIYAAWAARADYLKYRARLTRAVELQARIGNAADKLAELIRQFSKTGVQGPGEFYSIPELLRQTDNHDMQGHNLLMWRSMRRHLLGDLPMWDVPEAMPVEKSGEPLEIVIVERGELDPKESERHLLRYAWGTAPDCSALLGTMADAARSFKPSESGMVRAAIVSRKGTATTAYLRAFWHLLTDVHGIAMTTPIMQAMAIVANVVLNLPDVDVTYDTVSKALKRQMEDSSQ